MAELSLHFFGAPQIVLRGITVEPDTRKATALLVYLVVTQQPHTRDTLAAFLWPEFDQRRSRAALRRTISSLKKALDGYGLIIERDSLALNPRADIWVDVLRFNELTARCRVIQEQSLETLCQACLDDLIESTEIYRNDFLAGFTLRDSASFDEWQYSQSESLHMEITANLQVITECLSLSGDYDLAIQYAVKLLQMDPLHEPGHRNLMTLFALNGRRTKALRQYRECVRILEEELGVPPLEETTELYERILRGEIAGEEKFEVTDNVIGSAAHTPSPASYSQGSFVAQSEARHGDRFLALSAPLVGRQREWEQLMVAYSNSKGDGQLVVLEGEAGIGKTRLTQDFTDYVASQGATIVATQCFEGEAKLAYGPFIEGIRGAIRTGIRENQLLKLSPYSLAEASRLIPEIRTLVPNLPILPALDNPGARSRYYEAISQLLLAICDGPLPGILIIDDLHWADEATLDLLSYIVRRLNSRSLMVLVTWRDDLVGRQHRMRQLLIQTSRLGNAEMIRLERLESAAVQDLVQATLNRANMEELSNQLFRETEGIPFFLIEYLAIVRASENDSSLNTSDLQTDKLPMPRGVRDLLQSRLSKVSETASQLLHTASVIGRSFDYETLRLTSGRTDEETVTGLEELLAKGLIAEITDEPAGLIQKELHTKGDPYYDFTHEKLRSFVYDDTSFARRRLLHRRVATAIVERSLSGVSKGSRSLLAARTAYHFQQGGEEIQAANYYKIAGDSARELYANVEAVSHYQSALALGYSDTAFLYEALGDLMTMKANYTAALANYDAAAAVIEKEVGSGIELGHIEQKLGVIYHRMGEWDLAAHHYEVALTQFNDKVSQARLLTDWSLTAYQRGDDDSQAVELAQNALLLATEAKDMTSLAQAHNILGILASSRSELDAAYTHLEQSIELSQSNELPAIQIAAMNNLALAYRSSEMLDQAVNLTQNALVLCQEIGDRHREAALHNNLADLFHKEGRSEDAMRHLKKSAAIYAEIGGEGTVDKWRPEIWMLTEW